MLCPACIEEKCQAKHDEMRFIVRACVGVEALVVGRLVAHLVNANFVAVYHTATINWGVDIVKERLGAHTKERPAASTQ